MLSLKLATTGLIMFLTVVLMKEILGDDVPETFKFIAGSIGLIGLIMMISCFTVVVWTT